MKFDFDAKDVKKFLIVNFPYVFMCWLFDRVGEGWRLAPGADAVDKAMAAITTLGDLIIRRPLPSLHPFDLLVGLVGAVAVRMAVYYKVKNAKKYRHGVEYGSARWGTAEDIKPFINPGRMEDENRRPGGGDRLHHYGSQRF